MWQTCLVPVINDAEPMLVKNSCIWYRGRMGAHKPSLLRWLLTYPVKTVGLTGQVEIEAYKTGLCSAYLLSCISVRCTTVWVGLGFTPFDPTQYSSGPGRDSVLMWVNTGFDI